MVMSAWRYGWVERMSAWPSHKAITAVSTPPSKLVISDVRSVPNSHVAVGSLGAIRHGSRSRTRRC